MSNQVNADQSRECVEQLIPQGYDEIPTVSFYHSMLLSTTDTDSWLSKTTCDMGFIQQIFILVYLKDILRNDK